MILKITPIITIHPAIVVIIEGIKGIVKTLLIKLEPTAKETIMATIQTKR